MRSEQASVWVSAALQSVDVSLIVVMAHLAGLYGTDIYLR